MKWWLVVWRDCSLVDGIGNEMFLSVEYYYGNCVQHTSGFFASTSVY